MLAGALPEGTSLDCDGDQHKALGAQESFQGLPLPAREQASVQHYLRHQGLGGAQEITYPPNLQSDANPILTAEIVFLFLQALTSCQNAAKAVPRGPITLSGIH
jgi:hypothetical protein